MSKIVLTVLLLLFFNQVQAQVRVQPDNPNANSNISIQTRVGCDNSTITNYSISGNTVEADIECFPYIIGVPTPSAWVDNFIGQLPAGDYDFIFNIDDGMSVTQQTITITVGPAPTPVPLNGSLLILLVLAVVGLYHVKKESH